MANDQLATRESVVDATCAEKDAPTPKKRVANDTGLHISMRALLSIIAGLLVAEAVKACVFSLTAGSASALVTRINLGVALAGTLFVTRVVIDNLLYYAEPDVKTKESHYAIRVLLILLDLMSYAACYAIVARITVANVGTALNTGAIRWIVIYATAVEILHAIWCLIARYCLPNEDANDADSRNEWLDDWFRTSGFSAIVGIILSALACCSFYPGFEPVPPYLALTALIISIVSVVAYLRAMQKHYSRLRPT
jgi:hypothetical protein